MSSDYRSTLHLPRTSFLMRASLVEREPQILRWWAEARIAERLVEANRDKPKFVVHDGPSSAFDDLYLPQAFNKILKDIVAKQAAMAGQLTEVIPGWDGYSFSVEESVKAQLGQKQHAMSRLDFRRACRRYVEKAVRHQQEAYQRLGIFMSAHQRALTTDARFEAQTVRELAKLVERGFVRREKRPVAWCPHDRMSLSDRDVHVAQEQLVPAVYVALELASDPATMHSSLTDEAVHLVLWTSAPWMLPGTVAAAVREDTTYVAYRLAQAAHPASKVRTIVVAMDRLTAVLAEIAPDELSVRDATRFGVAEAAVLKDPSRIIAFVEGADLARCNIRAPMSDRVAPVVVSSDVALETGTGIVPVAPAHITSDYKLAQKYGLEVLSLIDEQGRYTPEVTGLAGQAALEAGSSIIASLQSSGDLLGPSDLTATQRLQSCARCSGLAFTRAVDQWFLSLDHEHLRQRCREAVDRDITWIPHHSKQGIVGMLSHRPDWRLTNRREWSLPFVSFGCVDCGRDILDASVMRRVADVFEQESSDAWITRKAAELLPQGFKCPFCESTNLQKGRDSLNAAFAVALAPVILNDLSPTQSLPAELAIELEYESRRRHVLSLIAGTAAREQPPFRTALSQTLPKWSGRTWPRMSETLSEFGSDLVRLGAAQIRRRSSIKPTEMSVGPYRRIRNTLRFALGNLSDFDPSKDSVPTGKLTDLDKWALEMTARWVDEVSEAYRTYKLHKVVRATTAFRVHSLSFFFDAIKNRLYTRAVSDLLRRGSQTVLWKIADALCRGLAPILSFTAEEAYRSLPGQAAESVFLAGFPSGDELRKGFAPGEGERLLRKFATFRSQVRRPVQKALESARTGEARRKQSAGRVVGGSLDAQVTLRAGSGLMGLLKGLEAELPELLKVSQIRLEPAGEAPEGLSVVISRASGHRCARCWCYTVSPDTDRAHPDLCPKCTGAVLTDFPNGLPQAAQVFHE